MSKPTIAIRCLGYVVDPNTHQALLQKQTGTGQLSGFSGEMKSGEFAPEAMSRLAEMAGLPKMGSTQWLHLGSRYSEGEKPTETVRTELFAAKRDLSARCLQEIPGLVVCAASPRKGSVVASHMAGHVREDLNNVIETMEANTPEVRRDRRRMLR